MDLPQAESAENLREQPGEVHDAGPLVGDDDRAGADVGARLEQGVVLVRGVRGASGGQEAAGGTAHEDRLERPAARPARESHELAERRAQRDLGDARALGAAELDEDRAGAAPGPGRRVGVRRR